MERIPPPQRHSTASAGHDDANRRITVATRVRPPIAAEGTEAGIVNSNPYSYALQSVMDKYGKAYISTQYFQFDHTFAAQDTNESVYADLGIDDMLRLFLHGGLCTIMAFGQTSSGKTHTMNYIQDRFIQEALNADFPNRLSFSIRYIEILGDGCYDLLQPARPAIKIMEDSFGVIQIVGAYRKPLASLQEAKELVKRGSSTRLSKTTARNERSSRSHAILCLEVKNEDLTLLESGVIYFVDLAGSEGARDYEQHDKELMKETVQINTSLSCLKDCLRSRTLASSAEGYKRHIHIPYRNSKLTLLLKQAFEMSSSRHSHTMVIGTLTPCAQDVKHSISTLKYLQPIHVAIESEYIPPPDPKNPATWSAEQVNAWIVEAANGRITPATIVGDGMSGMQLCRISEGEFIQRAMRNDGVGEKAAKHVYVKLWALVVDAKEKRRKEALKPRVSKEERYRLEDEFTRELIARSARSARY